MVGVWQFHGEPIKPDWSGFWYHSFSSDDSPKSLF
uniref:Uncharacterized protein n=1 Tax=Arundo donax TaxID=35708 RepID=A0A0A8ZKG3_ARUDO